jgi:hypothetical protein
VLAGAKKAVSGENGVRGRAGQAAAKALGKGAAGLGFVLRAVESDLARFKVYVEMDGASGQADRPVASRRPDGNGGGDRDRRQKTFEELDEGRRERQEHRERRRRQMAGAR